MYASSFLLAAALLLPAGAFAQSPTAPVTGQRAGTAPLLTTGSAGALRYTRRTASGGSVTYFSAVCSHDANHSQFAQLRQAFEASQPTAVFFADPDCGTDSTETAAIDHGGAAGYARFLAQQHRVPAEQLANSLAEYAYLQTKIDPERLKLFCLLRQTQRFRASTGASKALTARALRALINQSATFLPGTEQVVRNQAEFEAAYRKYCPAGTKWWQAPADWFNPAAAGTSSAFIRDVNGTIGEFREHYIYHKLAEMARAGERIFVVVGRDQLPAPAPSLASK